MSAARHADVLFVKKKPGADNDLHAFCIREGIPHVLFEDFGRALGVDLVPGLCAVPRAMDEDESGFGRHLCDFEQV